MNHLGLIEKYIYGLFEREKLLETKNPRTINTFTIDDPYLKSLIWNMKFSFNQNIRCILHKMDLSIPLKHFMSILGENKDRNASLFDDAEISHNLFLHSALPILLIKHEDEMQDIIFYACQENLINPHDFFFVLLFIL
jgi:hypothetical protein